MNMKLSNIVVFCAVAFLLTFLAHAAALWSTTGKVNNSGKFNLTSERITKDLDGKAVPLIMNQIWPFDSTQNVTVSVMGKRPVDDYVVVVVEVKALAPVQQEPSVEKPKESINPAAKDTSKSPNPAKLPSKVMLTGKMKLTYELVDGEWYLLNLENLSLRATPMD